MRQIETCNTSNCGLHPGCNFVVNCDCKLQVNLSALLQTWCGRLKLPFSLLSSLAWFNTLARHGVPCASPSFLALSIPIHSEQLSSDRYLMSASQYGVLRSHHSLSIVCRIAPLDKPLLHQAAVRLRLDCRPPIFRWGLAGTSNCSVWPYENRYVYEWIISMQLISQLCRGFGTAASSHSFFSARWAFWLFNTLVSVN